MINSEDCAKHSFSPFNSRLPNALPFFQKAQVMKQHFSRLPTNQTRHMPWPEASLPLSAPGAHGGRALAQLGVCGPFYLLHHREIPRQGNTHTFAGLTFLAFA